MDSSEFARLLPAANVSLTTTFQDLFLSGAAYSLTSTTTTSLINATNEIDAIGKLVTLEEVEHFLGDPVVIHGVEVGLGLIAMLLSKRFPVILAAVASLSLGLWTGLVIQDRQADNQPLFGQTVPEGEWVPITAGIVATASVAALTIVVWRLALAMLTGGLFVLLAVAGCRLANVSPKQVLQMGSSALSTYRIVGAVLLVATLLAGAVLAKRFHKEMAGFASAHLGTLLLLSGISYFAQKLSGTEAPFSLLDDLARIFAEVRNGRCNLWENAEGGAAFDGCDCGDQCQTEIIAWIASSWVVLAGRGLHWWLERRQANKAGATDEEVAPLTTSGESGDPSPQVLGTARV